MKEATAPYSSTALRKKLDMSLDALEIRLNHLKIGGLLEIDGKSYAKPHYTEQDYQRLSQLEQIIKEEKANGYRKSVILEKLNITSVVFDAIINKLGITARQHAPFCRPSFTADEFERIKQKAEENAKFGNNFFTLMQILAMTGISREVGNGIIKTLDISAALKTKKNAWLYAQADVERIKEYVKDHREVLKGLVSLNVAEMHLRIAAKTLKSMAANAGFPLLTNPLKLRTYFITREQYKHFKAQAADKRKREIQVAKACEAVNTYNSPEYAAAMEDLKNGKLPESPLAIMQKYKGLTPYKAGLIIRDYAKNKSQKPHK